ncbi:hypothetical protein H0H87_010287 [Tephrocybe sp. NHM501043]|nr:hypothetical protein H0H87_010287 [Tephrocybe sp. NHM501043]
MSPSVVTLVDQRPPFILKLASRVPTYAQALLSILAILLFNAFPSLRITTPPVRIISRKPRSSSLTSTTTILVDSDVADASKSTPEVVSEEDKAPRHRGLPFSTKIKLDHLVSSFKHASQSSARRIAIPAKRMSSQVIHAIHRFTPHLTPHHHHGHTNDEADSYFFKEKVTVADSTLEQNVAVPEKETSKAVDAVGEAVQGEVATESRADLTAPKKRSVFKRAARRASVALRITHHS